MTVTRLLLINSTGNGFWCDMHHTLSQLLLAEVTNRIPVVYWGSESMYGTDEASNAFEQYFLPVSQHGMDKLMKSINCGADIEVVGQYTDIEDVRRYMVNGCPYLELSSEELYRRMLKKYIRLQPEIIHEINNFYNENMAGRTVIAVHIRGSDKILEVSHLHELNKLYSGEIRGFLEKVPGADIFLMTDCKDILAEYKSLYGDRLIYTDCRRVLTKGEGVHFQKYQNNRLKGLEIIKDTWLAARCGCFIGNGFSNVSRAICELKDWQEGEVTLLY
ncbi:MAG TPA: O-fucosyltransferase family protein [Ruminiclostridium sp.]|nr:O-fucosyltransferase family protein [Ruminiclostridium sp.]